MSRTLVRHHPDVSIVVCTHNRAAMLGDALGSLLPLETDDGLKFEIVVVDNASADATPDVVRSIAARAGVSDNHVPAATSSPVGGLAAVRYVFESRKGIATARNRGVAEARGSWIAFFDDDQLADPRWLVELLATARQQRVRCVGGRVELKLPADCERRLAPVCRMLLGGTVGSHELRRYNHRVTPGTGNLLIHRTVFDQVGRFDENFHRRGEDTDLFLRMLSAGIEGWYTPRAIVQHVIPPERLTAGWFLDTAWRTARSMGRARLPAGVAGTGRPGGWRRAPAVAGRATCRRCGTRTGRTLPDDHRPPPSGRWFAAAGSELLAARSLRSATGAGMLNVTTLPAADLSAEQVACWTRLQERDPELASPYFRPEFTLAVAAVRRDVEVAVLAQDGETAGFFPYQRRWRSALPVGGRLSDFHGVIARPGLDCTAGELLAGCGLSSWSFHHLPVSQAAFAGHIHQTEGSPYLDLSRGFDAYRAGLSKSRREGIAQTLRKRRKLERDWGPVRFEFDCRDPAVLRALLDWKSAQYRRTGLTDVFAFDWSVALLRKIWTVQTPGFAGHMSALFAGGRPIAAHFGLRSHKVLHYWFPAFDIELAQFSPGSILQMDIAQAAAAAGLARIDLGRGSEQAKTSVMSGATPVADGIVDRRPVVGWARDRWSRARERLRTSTWRRHLEWPLRVTRPVREWLAFR
jgi:CelD/BcsL family acetyltransferase involved in cellulose biosynthesis/GT2 family glycosyltransferase